MLLKACVILINNFQKSLLIEEKESRKYCKLSVWIDVCILNCWLLIKKTKSKFFEFMKIDFAIRFCLCIVFEKIRYYPIEYRKYRILLFYDNNKNAANGDDL